METLSDEEMIRDDEQSQGIRFTRNTTLLRGHGHGHSYHTRTRAHSLYLTNSTLSTNTMTISSQNSVAAKLINRETYGSFSRRGRTRDKKIFEKIPPRLRFCLMDMVPTAIKNSHVFMGFSQCGQFLLSFTYSVQMNSTSRRDYSEGYSFRLHFLSWVPGQMVKPVHSVPLFDDDNVDNRVAVSMAQWKHNPSLLVVYGIAEISTENSYLSVIGVPRLGCRKCASLSNSAEVVDCGGKRCIEHNFAIHTKFYCAAESAICEPVVQLAYNNQILIYTDFIHILEINLINPDRMNEDVSLEERLFIGQTSKSYSPNYGKTQGGNNDCQTSPIVQSILADFSDIEVEPSVNVNVKPVQVPDMIAHEVIIQAYIPESSGCNEVYVGIEDCRESVPSPRTLISPPLRSPRRRPAEGLSRFNDMHRIADKTYEFVEETEPKCEKLSIFRKRRLADKKYEFSEENTENIVPFRVLRSNKKYYIGNSNKQSKRSKSPCEGTVLRVHNQINLPPVPLFTPETKCDSMDTDTNNMSDNMNDAEYRITAMHEDGTFKTIAVHDNSSKTLSEFNVHPQDPYLVHSGNSNCSKHFTRRFVESDDDITSIITDSEDDCISGYHVALPLAAHGAGYVPLQPVSMGTWERLRLETPVVLQASQRSLDIELLCNEVCVRLCRLNNKKFIYCFDWGCHVINVCQSSGCICGVCAMWLWATEIDDKSKSDEELVNCHACLDSNSLCMLHRRQYAAECLFVWDLVTGVYRTEHVSFKEDSTQDTSKESGSDRARQIALQLAPVSTSFSQETRLLTTLTGKSLKKLTDLDHFIEITKQHADSSESESSTTEESDSD